MRAYMETAFYIIYFVFMVVMGLYVMLKNKQKPMYLLGLACILLAVGDAFHLGPRSYGLFTETLDHPSDLLNGWLGYGKLFTSMTMTVFYLLFYFYFRAEFRIRHQKVYDYLIVIFVLSRFILLGLPFNEWRNNATPSWYGIIRNIPFVGIGVIVMILCYQNLNQTEFEKSIFYTIILSFVFYLAVVCFGHLSSWIGMMMLPKTICYMWIGFVFYKMTNHQLGD